MMSDVTSQAGTVLIEVIQPCERKKAEFCEDGIKAGAPMALAENKAVTIRPARLSRVHFQHASVEHSQQVGHGKGRAHMGALGAMSHAEDKVSNPLPQLATGRKVKS